MPQDTIQNLVNSDTVLLFLSPESGDSINVHDTLFVDSTLANVKDQKILVPSILQKHQLQTNELEAKKVGYGNEDWITVHLVLALMVYAWARLFYLKRLKQVYKSMVGIRFQGMMAREGNILRERISIALMIIYLITTSLLAYLFFTRVLHYDLLQLKSFKLFSFLMLLVIFLWIIKNVANTIIGKVFNNPVILSEYLLTNFIFNIATGSILFPILILAVYLPSVEMVYLGMFVWVIAFIYRLIRLVVTSISYTKFSLFNRILYLCTFELMPVIVLTKLVMSNLE